MQTKKWWQSITVWINILGIVGGVLGNVITDPSIHFSPAVNATLASILAILNIISRVAKSSPISGAPVDQTNSVTK